MTREEKAAVVKRIRPVILSYLEANGPVTADNMSGLRDAMGLNCSGELFRRAIGGLIDTGKVAYTRAKQTPPVGISASLGSEPRPMTVQLPGR